ncbi:MAG: PLP-dependent aminotransferase family protein [Verrucomicrobiales bacterium]|nr:PLP-dependent aminotransferase family protein [Verrucomicrobiales bacterium]
MSNPTTTTGFLSALGRRTEAPPIGWLMEYALTHPHVISLAAGFTDNPSLPVAETEAIVRRLLGRRRTGEPALQYGSTAGLPALRQLTAHRLSEQDRQASATDAPANPADAPACDASLYLPDRAVVTSGSQQLLYMLTEILCDPGDIVLVEDPTYFVYLGIAQSHGLDCRGVATGPEGIDLEHLEAILKRLQASGEIHRLKLLYLVSYHQNPTGRTTTFARKAAALRLLQRYERAAGHRLHLLEDAAYRELRFVGGDVPSALCVAGAAERVLYVGTYTKPFATGLRVGFGLLPEPIRTQVVRVKSNHDFGTSNLAQSILATAIAEGSYDAHVRRLQRRYRRKAGWMTDAIKASFPASIRWDAPGGGMYVWAAAPRRTRTGLKSALFQHALAHDVLYVPGRLCYADDPHRRAPDHEMRLSFGNAGRGEIEAGIARLGAALRELG